MHRAVEALSVAQRWGDVVFPPVCLACHGLVEEGRTFRNLCPTCASSVTRVSAPHCTVCGHPFFGEVDADRTCPHCQELQPEFSTGSTLVLFKGAARALVIELKYQGALHTLNDIAALVKERPDVMARLQGAVLVPVPLHPRKERERGFNQSRLLAEIFAQAAGSGTQVQLLLERVVDTVTQTAFDRRDRMDNLKNAFALAPRSRILADQHYFLVDDVFTTGSTLNCCAHVLRAAGCLRLDVVTFAHG